MKRNPTLGLLVLLALSACEGEVGSSVEAIPAERAALLYAELCAICHGPHGDGNGVRRRSLHSRLPDFTRESWRRSTTLDSIRMVIRSGRPGTDMPAWRSLTDAEARGLAEYVVTFADGRADDH